MRYAIVITLFLLWHSVGAQTCQGGLGDPIVNISFGSGSGLGPPLASGITNLQYVSYPCPHDGEYTIINETSNCFSGTWLVGLHDHTGDPNGYFMLINASYNPSDFYVQTIGGLCGGTTYQFAAWMMNVGVINDQIRPNVTFRVEKTDGTVLQSVNTGDIPLASSNSWTQYAFYFDTPPGVSSVVLRMVNNAPGGNGNDLALDDITFRATGPSVKATVAGYTGNAVTVCDGSMAVLHLSSSVENDCYPSAVYQWQQSTDGGASWNNIAGAGALSLDLPAGGPGSELYRMAVSDAGNVGIKTCSVASDPVTVNILRLPEPSVSISSTPYVCEGQVVNFVASTVDGGTGPLFQWKLNGVDVGTGDSSFVLQSPVSADVVSCVMTSNAVCAADPVVVSNPLSVPVVPVPVTGVDMMVSADHICQDSLVLFAGSPSNGGSSPSFDWLVNGVVVDSSGPVFATRQLKNGDVVGLEMRGSLRCSPLVVAPQEVAMTVWDLPTIDLFGDTVIAGGSSLVLAPVIGGDIASYRWSPAVGLSDAEVAHPVARPLGTTAYQLEVTTVEGCRASASTKVEVYYDVQMPGAFTPNGDGHNDVFRIPPVVPVHIRRLAVFNRYGAMLFLSQNAGVGWDGTVNGVAQPAGVYVWELEYDNPVTRRVEKKKGTIILIR
ncbi:MAG: gliding motility-associated C-terminal domain-containing protein [Bacteroidetes bacterium]|nr:gliding motility-associated C-terminal domain-containing protein [Bacteroidota bacterium]